MARKGSGRGRSSFAKKYFLHEKTMRSFLRSYVLVFIIPVLLVYSAMFINGYHSVRKSNFDAVHFAASQVRQQVDSQLYSLLAISATINNDADFLSVATVGEEELDESSVLSMYHLSETFKEMYAVSNRFSQMALYMPENDYCVSIRNALPVNREFPDLEEMGVTLESREAWEKILSVDSAAPILMQNRNSVMYCIQLPGVGRSSGTLMIPIRSDYIHNLFSFEEMMPTFGGLVSGDGTMLYSRNLPDENWAERISADGMNGQFASGKNVYSYTKLTNANAYVVLGVPSYALNMNLVKQCMFYVPILLVSLALFALITFYCAVRSYDPIKKLCSIAAHESDENEFDAVQAIRTRLLEAMDAKRDMESSHKLMSEIERGSWMFRELRSRNVNALLEQAFDMDADEISDYHWVCVCAVLADKFSGLFKTEEAEGMSLDWMPLFSDCLMEMLDDDCRVLPILLGSSAMFLIRMEKNVDLKRVFTPIRELLIESYTYETRIAISECVKGSERFEDQFRLMSDQCMFAIEDSSLVGEGSILSYPELFGSKKRVPSETFVLEAQLADMLRHGEIGKAAEILEKMNRLLVPLNGSEKAENESSGASKNALAEWIRSVVEEEYTDSGLSVSAIAERAGKSPDYISRCFRQKYDIGLLDYIHRRRIARAKELLCDESASVGSIAPKVGYTSVDSFIRVFKKLEGVTPGKYQSAGKQNEEC